MATSLYCAYACNHLAQSTTALHQAAVCNNPDLVRQLIESGAQVDARDEMGALEAAQALLRGGATIEAATDENNFTALHQASQDRQVDLIELLVFHGARIDARDKTDDRSALDITLHQRCARSFEALVRAGADINAKNSSGQTPLHCAAASGDPAIVRILLQAGADIDARDSGPRNETPLHYAALSGNLGAVSAVKTLLQAGADINARDRHGATPLHYAAIRSSGQSASIVAALCKAGAEIDAQDSRMDGHAALLGQRGYHRFDLQVRRNRAQRTPNRTPLHYAVLERDTAVVKVLVRMLADVNIPDCNDKSPLVYANVMQDFTLLELLLPAGGSDGLREFFENSDGGAICYRSSKCTFPIRISPGCYRSPGWRHRLNPENVGRTVKLLQQVAGLNARISNLRGETALHIATERRDTPLVKALLKAGADVNAQDMRRQSPLYYAVWVKSVILIEVLLQAGADINARDSRGQTALHYAIVDPMAREYIEVLRALLDAGADINAQDNRQQTPLHYAIERCLDLEALQQVEETDPATDPEKGPEIDIETDPLTDNPEKDPDTDPDTDPEKDPDTDPDTDPEKDPDTDPDTVPETDPEKDPDTVIGDPQQSLSQNDAEGTEHEAIGVDKTTVDGQGSVEQNVREDYTDAAPGSDDDEVIFIEEDASDEDVVLIQSIRFR
eukprot:gene19831-23717_t